MQASIPVGKSTLRPHIPSILIAVILCGTAPALCAAARDEGAMIQLPLRMDSFRRPLLRSLLGLSSTPVLISPQHQRRLPTLRAVPSAAEHTMKAEEWTHLFAIY